MQGEFRAAARRAHAMAQRLKHLRKRIRNHDKPSFSAIARYAEMSADIMAEEVSDWAFVYRAKPLTLPG